MALTYSFFFFLGPFLRFGISVLTVAFVFLQFNWLSYRDYENISEYIDDTDVPLFLSNTALISYWVVGRHCLERVMKQFGLKQIVLPRFLKSFPRNEMVPIRENRREKLRAIYVGVWNKRVDAITFGEEGDDGPHTDAYFQWYRQVTRPRIGRPTSGHSPNLKSVSSQVNSFILTFLLF